MHSGFFTINANLGKNTFFWFSEALSGQADAPLLLWLQGGPGASSLFGLFTGLIFTKPLNPHPKLSTSCS